MMQTEVIVSLSFLCTLNCSCLDAYLFIVFHGASQLNYKELSLYCSSFITAVKCTPISTYLLCFQLMMKKFHQRFQEFSGQKKTKHADDLNDYALKENRLEKQISKQLFVASGTYYQTFGKLKWCIQPHSSWKLRGFMEILNSLKLLGQTLSKSLSQEVDYKFQNMNYLN